MLDFLEKIYLKSWNTIVRLLLNGTIGMVVLNKQNWLLEKMDVIDSNFSWFKLIGAAQELDNIDVSETDIIQKLNLWKFL